MRGPCSRLYDPAIQIVPSRRVIVHVVRGVPDAILLDKRKHVISHGNACGHRGADMCVAEVALSHGRKLFQRARQVQGKSRSFGGTGRIRNFSRQNDSLARRFVQAALW